jgi:hypothetical protein
MKTILSALVASVCLIHAGSFAADAPASDAAKPAKSSQQSKMKTCNADAKTKGLKGDERKHFMSECLKAK